MLKRHRHTAQHEPRGMVPRHASAACRPATTLAGARLLAHTPAHAAAPRASKPGEPASTPPGPPRSPAWGRGGTCCCCRGRRRRPQPSRLTRPNREARLCLLSSHDVPHRAAGAPSTSKCYPPPLYYFPPDNSEIRAAALCSGGVSRLAAAAFAMEKTTSPSEATVAVRQRNSLNFIPGYCAMCATPRPHQGYQFWSRVRYSARIQPLSIG